MAPMLGWLLACSVKAGLLLAASWLGAGVLRRSTAAARHQIWTLGVLGALALPVMCWVVPALAGPAATSTRVGESSLEAAAVVVTGSVMPSATTTWPQWLAIAWALGALVVAVRLVRSHAAARGLLRAADANVDGAWSRALREAAGSLALGRRVVVLRSEQIGSPMTIGVLRPRVVLPAAADGWSPARLRAVLVHELGHVRRRDAAIQLAAQLACALYWWNPLAWLAAARLRMEREHACDDLVLDAGILPSSYAADLLEVARSISRAAHAGAICMVDRSSTEARLRRILDVTAARRPLRARFRIAACALTAATAVTIACTSSPPPTTTPESLARLVLGMPFVREPTPQGPPYLPPPANHGAIDLAVVKAEIQRRAGALERCYERRLAARPALSGTVEIHWVIDESGKVPDACITKDTVQDAEITACVNKLVLDGGRFPAPRGGSVDVSMPFVFAPGATLSAREPG